MAHITTVIGPLQTKFSSRLNHQKWFSPIAATIAVVMQFFFASLLVEDARTGPEAKSEQRISFRLIELPPASEDQPSVERFRPRSVVKVNAGQSQISRTSSSTVAEPMPRNTDLAPYAAPANVNQTLQIFRLDGSIELPAEKTSSRAFSTDYTQRGKEILQRGHNLTQCSPTQYSSKYLVRYENLGDEMARKYGVFLGLYNPYSALLLQQRDAAAAAACDEQG